MLIPYFPFFAFVLVAAGLLARPLSGTKSSHRCVGFVRPYKGTVWDPGQCCLCVGAHTARHCSPVLCSTRAAATPESPAAGIVSHGWDVGFVCPSKLQRLDAGTGWRKSGLEMQAVAQVCFVEYNEDAFQAWLVFNQFFRQRWPREMFELSWWWLCNLMQASCVREASILPDKRGQKCAASRFVGSVCAWLRCSLSA